MSNNKERIPWRPEDAKSFSEYLKPFNKEQDLTKKLASPNVFGNYDEEKKGGGDTEKFKEFIMSKLSNKLPTAREYLIKKLDMSPVQIFTLYKGYVDATEEYKDLHCEALKEENEKLKDVLRKIRTLHAECWEDYELAEALHCIDHLAEQALNKEG